MPTDAKPLFRPEAVRSKVRTFELPARADRGKFAKGRRCSPAARSSNSKRPKFGTSSCPTSSLDALGHATVSDNPAVYFRGGGRGGREEVADLCAAQAAGAGSPLPDERPAR